LSSGDFQVQQIIEFASNHGGLVGGFGAVILFLLWTEFARFTRGYVELSPVQAVQKINQGETVVVDISPSADFAKGHLANAKPIALSRFSKPDPEIEKIVSKPVLIVCRNGQTAHQAAARLVKLGAKDVAVLKGGITQWSADQFPLSRK